MLLHLGDVVRGKGKGGRNQGCLTWVLREGWYLSQGMLEQM